MSAKGVMPVDYNKPFVRRAAVPTVTPRNMGRTYPEGPRSGRENDADAHAEDVWHVRYDGQDFRDG